MNDNILHTPFLYCNMDEIRSIRLSRTHYGKPVVRIDYKGVVDADRFADYHECYALLNALDARYGDMLNTYIEWYDTFETEYGADDDD